MPKVTDVKLKICQNANLAMTKLSYSHHMKEVCLLFVQCTKTQWHPTFTNIYTLQTVCMTHPSPFTLSVNTYSSRLGCERKEKEH